ncbi:serine/threonine-protein phosphatase 6 regulatory ankyrin repeat subunit B-like isoform X2 [Contarinia nasturtii]|uniref:serine/threonine-protein phosphatase 6 regulatory ankyrin repeat subunit B-like isoform X2 n=1 Tax=Contarinia nasturtii TaxID=265458 RepID=UPI0012D37AC7|nr:serine/threonine-protein phosphatase 6 regulatory ankyrin repeat subunit B-like isoform X2 [Contarinia nasturtii]XP_031635583.1 serine/threonine-protein phosphatase 6 regulatory ankyrin repeat subunit B-like isoform X2 [Contarinia nasturtii]
MKILLAIGLIISAASAIDVVSVDIPEFHQRVSKGGLPAIEQLIDQGVYLNSNGMTEKYNGMTALSLAVKMGYDEVVEYLAKIGVDLNQPNDDKSTPLEIALELDNMKVATTLVEYGCELKLNKNEWRLIALGCFAHNVSASAFEKFENHDINITALWKEALKKAVQNNDLKGTEQLVQHCGIDLKQLRDSYPLHWAAAGNQVELMKFLIAHGSDVNASDGYPEWRPIHMAAWSGHTEAVKLLANSGADLDAKNVFGYTGLMFAAWHGYLKMAQLLVENGADVNTEDTNGDTAWNHALLNGRDELVEYLSKFRHVEKEIAKDSSDENIKNEYMIVNAPASSDEKLEDKMEIVKIIILKDFKGESPINNVVVEEGYTGRAKSWKEAIKRNPLHIFTFPDVI